MLWIGVSCKHMLWIGTTAGVILTLRLPKQQLSNNSSQQEIDSRLLNIDGKMGGVPPPSLPSVVQDLVLAYLLLVGI